MPMSRYVSELIQDKDMEKLSQRTNRLNDDTGSRTGEAGRFKFILRGLIMANRTTRISQLTINFPEDVAQSEPIKLPVLSVGRSVPSEASRTPRSPREHVQLFV